MKNNIDDEFDFGFSAVSEEELKAVEKQAAAQAAAHAETHQQKLEALYKLVMPLLNSLGNDSDKDYIYWPGRQAKMKQFIAKVESIVK